MTSFAPIAVQPVKTKQYLPLPLFIFFPNTLVLVFQFAPTFMQHQKKGSKCDSFLLLAKGLWIASIKCILHL